ncbi:MAG TPA: META domain-containing protein [Burkholderiales bacterium]|nr:META domain-containing protein [Burkholderiales bacterium]
MRLLTIPLAALLAACAQTPPQGEAVGLVGPTWQLVSFKGGDGRVEVPIDKSQFQLVFNANGSVFARLDCNRGNGTWKSPGPNRIEFGPMATTRAMCPPGWLQDHVPRQLQNIRSYAIRDGHLFLSLVADGGIFEFEPAR